MKKKSWLSNKKNKKIIIVAVLLLVIGLGYAFLNANLKINGISNIGNVKWEVYFENSALTEGNTLAGAAAPVIEQGTKPTEIGYNVTFNTPGEVYEFTVDVKNGGTIDATVTKLESTLKIGDDDPVTITSKDDLPSYMDYDLTYDDGSAIEVPFDLAKTEHKTIKLRLTFKQDITAEELEEARNKSLRFNVGLFSKQRGAPDPSDDDDQGSYVYTSMRSTTDVILELNGPISSAVTTYNTPEAALSDINLGDLSDGPISTFLRHTLDENDNIIKTDIGFVISEDLASTYNLTAGMYYLDSSKSFSELKDYLHDIFGDEYSAYNPDFPNIFICGVPTLDVHISDAIIVTDGGEEYIGQSGNFKCKIQGNKSYCGDYNYFL